MLNQFRIFIAEDEPSIALDLASKVDEAHGQVIGPAGRAGEALSLLEHTRPDVGVLDVHLGDGKVTPVAELLMRRGILILFHSGRLPLHLRYPGVPVYFKPIPAADLEIARLLGQSGIN